ncbi:MAG: Fe(3+) ABC transporter substrate-binding protein [Proteobacteria bacterium]|nr:Fe(3+) ABC transporter substrate-binding protein [Pseudomonadota bacterium]
MMQRQLRQIAMIALAALTAGLTNTASSAALSAEVNIYSYREEALIKPQLEAFRKATEISYKLITGTAGGLLQRLKNEGMNSPADLLFTADAGRLHRALQMGLLQPIRSETLETQIPARFRDPEGRWFGLGVRARAIFYHIDRVKPSELSSFEDLADPKWKGRILIRSSGNIYNQSLLASLINHHGAKKAETWARGMVANLARKPQGGDRDQLRAVAAGEGDIAIANNYYYARLLTSKKAADRKVTDKVKVFWPNQTGPYDRGTHVNISGAAVTKSAKNRANAIRLLEFLVGEEAQNIYASVGYEYPVRKGIARGSVVAGMGQFKMDNLPLENLGRNNAEAVRIFDRVGWR